MTESVVVPRFIATAAASSCADAERMVRAAGIPGVLRDPETVRTPSANTYRLWGSVVSRAGRADAGLLAAAEYEPGTLDLFDYLLSTAPTVGEGLARAAAHVHLVSSNSVFSSHESGDEITFGYGVRHGDAELRGVVAEFALAVVVAQLRHATGTAFAPIRVGFAHRAPRRRDAHAGYTEAFGDARVDFETGADTITLHRADLTQPLVTADPALAVIIRRAADALPPPRQAPESAVPGLHAAIRAQLADGRPSLAEAARMLAVSPRTLQRRLGEFGTTWRAELDAVRREQSAGLLHTCAGPAQRAARLGFAESRSLRRAMSRWDAREREASRPLLRDAVRDGGVDGVGNGTRDGVPDGVPGRVTGGEPGGGPGGEPGRVTDGEPGRVTDGEPGRVTGGEPGGVPGGEPGRTREGAGRDRRRSTVAAGRATGPEEEAEAS
jgi:AraC-like DNA-binding protein